ncbi:hypothetical protein BGX29_001447 [Mortierella sp. GBA35]
MARENIHQQQCQQLKDLAKAVRDPDSRHYNRAIANTAQELRDMVKTRGQHLDLRIFITFLADPMLSAQMAEIKGNDPWITMSDAAMKILTGTLPARPTTMRWDNATNTGIGARKIQRQPQPEPDHLLEAVHTLLLLHFPDSHNA